MDDLAGVEIVWEEEWYDGPLTGVARYGSNLYWFTPASPDWYREWGFDRRRYTLLTMTSDELDAIDERIRDSETLDENEYRTKYHPVDRDEAGFQPHDGGPVGHFKVHDGTDSSD